MRFPRLNNKIISDMNTKKTDWGGQNYTSPSLEVIELNVEASICVVASNTPGYGDGDNDLGDI